MSATQLKPEFIEILQPLGANAGDFFLAASLYHARKISFAAAAELAGLSLEAFHCRLLEHFGRGFTIDDEAALEDMATVQAITNDKP